MLRVTLKVIAFAGLILAIAWICFEPNKYDPWIAAVAALVVFLGLFLPDALRYKKGQHQLISGTSSGIQAGGDVNINVNSNGRHR